MQELNIALRTGNWRFKCSNEVVYSDVSIQIAKMSRKRFYFRWQVASLFPLFYLTPHVTAWRQVKRPSLVLTNHDCILLNCFRNITLILRKTLIEMRLVSLAMQPGEPRYFRLFKNIYVEQPESKSLQKKMSVIAHFEDCQQGWDDATGIARQSHTHFSTVHQAASLASPLN